MGKNVTVKYVHVSNDDSSHAPMADMTIGKEYHAYLPDFGEIDKDGMRVRYSDEVWVLSDDVGEEVVVQLSDGLEVVENK